MDTTYYSEETAAVIDDLDVLDTFFSDHSCIDGDGEDEDLDFDLDVDDDIDIS